MQVLMPLNFNKQDKDLIKLVMQKEKLINTNKR